MIPLTEFIHSVPHPNYYLPTLTELEDEASHGLFASSERTQNLGRNPSPPAQEGCSRPERLVIPPQHLTIMANLLLQ